MAKVKIIKKVGIPKQVSVEWFDNLVKCAMMTPVLLRRLGKLDRRIRQLDPELKGRKHILVWRSVGGLGDIVMQSVIARALKEKDPNCFVTYQVPEQYLAIPKHNPYVDKAEIAECPFCEDGYDETIKLSQPCPASVYELIKSDITKDRTDLFLKAAGIKTKDKSLSYQVKIEEKKWAEKFLKGNKALDKIKIGFGLRSIEERRNWTRGKELINLIYKEIKNSKIFIFDHNAQMAWEDEKVINICGFPLEDVAAIMEKLDLIIGPDSGLLHLAGALGKPILGLFGPIPPFFRLKNYNAEWIWHQPYKECPCWYSFPCGNSKCMEMITPQAVLEKVKKILKRNNSIITKLPEDHKFNFEGKRLLIERTDRGLGDLLTITVVVRELKKQFPSCYVIFKVPSYYKPILENNPYIDDIIGLGENIEKDIFVSYSRPCPAGVYEHYHNRSIFKSRIDIFCEYLGFNPTDKTPVFHLRDEEIKQGMEFFEKYGASSKKKVGIALVAGEIWVSWTREGNLELIKLLIKKGYVPVIFTMESQEPMNIKGAIDVHNEPIRKMASIFKNCDVAITQDGGMSHLAGALKIPQIGLFGPTNPKYRISMYDKAHWIVSHKDICPLGYDNDKFCWYYSECTVSKDCPNGRTDVIPSCLRAIKAKEVLGKIEEVFNA